MKVLQSIEGKIFREGVCALICLYALWKCVEARELLLRITHQLLGCREAADTAQEWLAHPYLEITGVGLHLFSSLCVSFVCCFCFFETDFSL